MVKKILNEINKVVIGKEEVVEKVLMAILAKGHILVEDIPGVGKTTLAIAFSKVLDLKCKRLQFTPDVLPADITGFSIYNRELGAFEYKEGPIMCNLFLADEVNRTSSKTQSALLEVMEEGNITVDGVTREIKKPFIVIATQNPIGSIGTHMLPESQLDRFIIKLTLGYPDVKSEINILKSKHNRIAMDEISKIVSKNEIINMQNNVDNVFIHDDIYEYIANLVAATRNNQYISLGVSPRGSVALSRMAKARAFICEREYVIPDDVLYVFKDVVGHRIILSQKSKINNINLEEVIKSIEKQVKMPRLK